jgi:hypothetical protein
VKVSKGTAELVRFVRETTAGSGARARPEDQRFVSAEFLVVAVLQDLQDDLVAPPFLTWTGQMTNSFFQEQDLN